MVNVNFELCTRCGICINRFQGYCMNSVEGKPKIDYDICNQCQKCIAICPHQAIAMNDKLANKITEPLQIQVEELEKLFERRRSIKRFKDVKVPREILQKIAQVANYAPNQNKNIEMIIIDKPEIIQMIDQAALKFVGTIYKILFSNKLLSGFVGLFSKSFLTIKRKMEFDLHIQRHIVKENTAALFLLLGNPRVPVTESSAHYLLDHMLIFAEALGVGSCLMDSLKLSINANSKIKQSLGVSRREKVLGVLAVGYSNESILNIPKGYEMKICWNGDKIEG